MLEQLNRVCKKYDLRYFASNGTLLGAIRHEGFIPWDDDVDIVMPRPDYQRARSRIPYDTAKEVSIITHGSRCIFFPKAYFDHVKWMNFEYIKLPIPENSDEILKRHYGNYRELPPKEKRGQHHRIFFDPDKPYTEYIGIMTREEAEKLLNNY